MVVHLFYFQLIQNSLEAEPIITLKKLKRAYVCHSPIGVGGGLCEICEIVISSFSAAFRGHFS